MLPVIIPKPADLLTTDDVQELQTAVSGGGIAAANALAAGSEKHIFQYIPPALWADIVAGTSTVDLSSYILTAIASFTRGGVLKFPIGKFCLAVGLALNGTINNVELQGVNGVLNIVPGGSYTGTSTEFEWFGAANSTILTINTENGSRVRGVTFSTRSTVAGDIQIAGVTAIRFINRAVTRYGTIEKCQFRRIDYGIHFFDDGLDAASNNNMDGHAITSCVFDTYVCAVRVNQTNVYNTALTACSFFGSTKYTKHHVWIEKGHVDVFGGFIGTLKDAASVGGKDGISLYVQNGWVNVSNLYGECHNGPFMVWESAAPTGIASTLTACIILNATASLPTTYNLLNKTNENIVIVGGRIAGAVSQFAGTTGQIIGMGGFAFAVDATSEPNGCSYFGGNGTSRGVIGTAANPVGHSGGGQARLLGYSPALYFYDYTTAKPAQISFTANGVRVGQPGTTAGAYFDMAATQLDLASANWQLYVQGTTSKPIKLFTVRIAQGAGSPEGVWAAPVGSTYHRTDGGGGTSFYVKESGAGNTGWVAK